MPSRGSGLAVAVARTTFSPLRTTAEPWACLASFPVSNERFLPPASATEGYVGSGFIDKSFGQEAALGRGVRTDRRVPVKSRLGNARCFGLIGLGKAGPTRD